MEAIIWTIIIVLLLFIVVKLRQRLLSNIEVTAIDLSIAIMPFVAWLLVSGKLTELKIGEVSFKTNIVKAQSKKIIDSNINQLDIHVTPSVLKADIGQIDYIIQDQREALVFITGYDNYSAKAIEEYFRKLLSTTLKYVIVQDENENFIGIISFNFLANQLLKENNEINSEWFLYVIANNKKEDLLKIKGFIPKEFSVTFNDSRASALNKAIEVNSEFLPVISNDNKFKGIITQSRLSALILFDLYSQTDH